jgi:hypothetical protein
VEVGVGGCRIWRRCKVSGRSGASGAALEGIMGERDEAWCGAVIRGQRQIPPAFWVVRRE